MGTLAPHQQRVVEEAEALSIDLRALRIFINGGRGEKFVTLPLDEQHRLITQSVHMQGYLQILQARIAHFPP